MVGKRIMHNSVVSRSNQVSVCSYCFSPLGIPRAFLWFVIVFVHARVATVEIVLKIVDWIGIRSAGKCSTQAACVEF